MLTSTFDQLPTSECGRFPALPCRSNVLLMLPVMAADFCCYFENPAVRIAERL